jgi:hypothetical protein
LNKIVPEKSAKPNGLDMENNEERINVIKIRNKNLLTSVVLKLNYLNIIEIL